MIVLNQSISGREKERERERVRERNEVRRECLADLELALSKLGQGPWTKM